MSKDYLTPVDGLLIGKVVLPVEKIKRFSLQDPLLRFPQQIINSVGNMKVLACMDRRFCTDFIGHDADGEFDVDEKCSLIMVTQA